MRVHPVLLAEATTVNTNNSYNTAQHEIFAMTLVSLSIKGLQQHYSELVKPVHRGRLSTQTQVSEIYLNSSFLVQS